MDACCAPNSDSCDWPATMACPVSGTRSRKVDPRTVKALIRHLPFAMAAAQYYFCEAPGCDVVYFPAQPEAPTFHRDDLLVPVGQKEDSDSALVCYCFGLTRKDIREELERTGESTVGKRITAEVKAGRCACELKNPSGKCCLGNITRVAQEWRQAQKAPA